MTPEEIIEMAKQAGFEEHQAKFDTRFEPFAKLIAEKERKEFDVLFAEHQKLLGELQAMRLARDEEDFC